MASIDASTAEVQKANSEDFWAAITTDSQTRLAGGIDAIWLDGAVHPMLDRSVAQIGAPEAWAAGYTGKGVKVAVLDTGVDLNHPDLADKVIESQSFVDGESVQDGHGHGTHVASTIAGSGAASGGTYRGVAPDAELIIGKVLNNAGSGYDSQIIAGMQWAVDQGADVVSISIGGALTDGTDPMSQAVDQLSADSDTLFVIAAGNNYNPVTISAPGAAESALTVAAVDRDDTRAPFSSQGPLIGGGLKPDISAPGVGIVAARAAGTSMGNPVDDYYTAASGTSMATPHVAGAAALLAQEHPDWDGEHLKSVLTSTAKDVGLKAWESGSGRVDVARAVRQDVYGSGPVDFGDLRSPRTDPTTQTLTYTNDSDQPISLQLTGQFSRSDTGEVDGVLSAPDSVDVPAHGTTSVEIAIAASAEPGWYEGELTASSGDVQVRTAIGAYVERPKSTLTLEVKLPEGASDVSMDPWYLLKIDDESDLDRNKNRLVGAAQPQLVGQIWNGVWSVETAVSWRDPQGRRHLALLTDPEVEVDGDTTVTLDAAKARVVSVDVPRPAVENETAVTLSRISASGVTGLWVDASATLRNGLTISASPTGAVEDGQLTWGNQSLLVADPITMSVPGAAGLRLTPRYLGMDADIARLDGKRTLPLVAAGAGLPSDFRGLDVRGKLALLDVGDLCPATAFACDDWSISERLRTAADSGAAGVLMFGGAGRIGTDAMAASAVTLPALTVPSSEGQRLLDRLEQRPVKVKVDATDTIDYVYSLSYPSDGRVPADLHNVVTRKDLYRTETQMHGDAPGVVNMDWASHLEHNRSVGTTWLTVRGPAVLTEYVGPLRDDVRRWRTATMTYDGPNTGGWNGWGGSTYGIYTKPGHTVEVMGAQPQVPSSVREDTPEMADYAWLWCQECRIDDLLFTNRYFDSDGRNPSADTLGFGEQTVRRLFDADGNEIPLKEAMFFLPPFFGISTSYFVVPDEEQSYRLTEKTVNPSPAQRFARTSRTEWTFRSGRPSTGFPAIPQVGWGVGCVGWWLISGDVGRSGPCQAESSLFIGYDLGLDLDNTLPAGTSHQIEISGYHHSLSGSDPELTKIKLWASFDDEATWQKVDLKKSGYNTYTATINQPKLKRTTGAVSLRVTAEDAAGNTVEQTVDRAYGLR